MRYLSRSVALHRQKGAVAVEAALVTTFILLPLVAFILFFGRYFWYYTAAQKAVHDATLYLASAPLVDLRSNNAGTLSEGIIVSELADIDQTALSTKTVVIVCFYRIPASATFLSVFPCGINATPVSVRASLSITVSDPFLAPFTGPIVGADGLIILAGATMRYVGR
jgi:Flp pilus assembly protein TadG